MAANACAPVSGVSPLPATARRASLSSSLSSVASPVAICPSSHLRKPGIGESVANTLRLRNSLLSSSTTRLIRKLPKLIPFRPRWQLLME